MVTIFRKGQFCSVMHGKYERLLLFPILTILLRSILHDPKAFNNPMEYQPERYLKDGKLNPDVMDPDSAAFGFGRRSVDPSSNIFRNVHLTIFPQYLSWKTPKRQHVILNCFLSSCSL